MGFVIHIQAGLSHPLLDDVKGFVSMSLWLNVTSGIPQVSVLRTVLFPLYNNDLPGTVKKCIYVFPMTQKFTAR